MTTTDTEAFTRSITTRLDKLAEQAVDLRTSALKMRVWLSTSHDPELYRQCLAACLAAGLATDSPIAMFSTDITRIIQEVIDAHE